MESETVQKLQYVRIWVEVAPKETNAQNSRAVWIQTYAGVWSLQSVTLYSPEDDDDWLFDQ